MTATLTATPVRPEWEAFAERALWIRDKRQRFRPFFLNAFQREYQRRYRQAVRSLRREHVLVLKYRQGGVTTLEMAKSYWRAANRDFQQVAALAHDAESTEKMFRMAHLFHEVAASGGGLHGSKRELVFPDRHSMFYIGTAGSPGFGRGQTFSRVHGSETARWPGKPQVVEDLVVGLTEACEGEIVLETTAKGASGYFYELWRQAQDRPGTWGTVFLPWFCDPRLSVLLSPAREEEVRDTLAEDERHLVEREGVTLGQIAWRREKWEKLRGVAIQEYPEDPVTAFLTSGNSYFDLLVVSSLVPRCGEPVVRRHVPGGEILIWRKPESERLYDAGADCSEGVSGGDYSCMGILDRESCEQVATLHGLFRPEVFARLMVQLAREYHEARIAIEKNNHGHSVINSVVNTERYPTRKLYHHKPYDLRGGKLDPRVGATMDAENRPIVLSELAAAVENRRMLVHDRGFLDECRTFKSNNAGKYEAEAGKHDDRVFAWGWALQMRKVKLLVPIVSV